jgi:hypothetical protein
MADDGSIGCRPALNRKLVLARPHDRGNLLVPLQHPPRHGRHRDRHRVGTPGPTLHRRTRP